MIEYHQAIQQIEAEIARVLADWPSDWINFNWPGYTYEHTYRVRNLALTLARELGAEPQIVDLAALLHDIGKPAGEPHAEPGVQRAAPILAALGVDEETSGRILSIIGGHLACNIADPLENLALYDADFIDANFGAIAFTRYISIRAHRGNRVTEMAAEAAGWLERIEERRLKVITEPGKRMTTVRVGRMHDFYRQLSADLAAGSGPALGIARFLEADAARPSLARQAQRMEECLKGQGATNDLVSGAFLADFLEKLESEAAGAS
jgi:putative nucleotidyltransferase with HDIG domain